MPLVVNEKSLGVIEVFNKPGGFNQSDQETLATFATSVAFAIENARLLREYRDKDWAPAKAACNRGADPDRPGSGFQWGFNYEVIWDKFGGLLVDVVTPLKPGVNPDRTSKVGLAISALQVEVAQMDRWVTKVKAAKKLHETIVGLYGGFMSARAATAEAQGATPAQPAAVETEEPKLTDEVKPLYRRRGR